MEFKMKKPTVCVAMDGDCCCIHQAASFPFNDKYVGKPVCSVCALQCAVSGKGSSGSGCDHTSHRLGPPDAETGLYMGTHESFHCRRAIGCPRPYVLRISPHLRYRIRIRHRSPTLAA